MLTVCESCHRAPAELRVTRGEAEPFAVCYGCRPLPTPAPRVVVMASRRRCPAWWRGCVEHDACIERRRAHWRASKARRRAAARG